MEEQPTPTIEEQVARLLEQGAFTTLPAREAGTGGLPGEPQTPARAARTKRRARRRSPYRYAALLAVGLFCYALIIGLAALVWGYLTFASQGDVSVGVAMPMTIFCGAIFLSCYLVTTLSRGGSVFPSVAVALLANLISYVVAFGGAEAPPLQLKGLALKLLFSLIVAMIGFVVSKLMYLRGHSQSTFEDKAA